MEIYAGKKVKVKRNLKANETYGGTYFYENMKKYCGGIVTVSTYPDNDNEVEIEEDDGDNYWNVVMFTEIREPKEELNNNGTQEIVESLDKLREEINKRTMYDDAIKENIMNKVREIPVKELSDELYKDVDKYIKEKYGVLPKKIELIKDNTSKATITGIFHNKFEDIVKIVSKGVPLMLTGPAGAGKNYTLEQVAKALELEFYFTNAVTQEYKLTGFIDANGVYQETQFYKAFKDGGLFFLDEIDASCPESLIVLNSAIANNYFDFPNGRINAQEKLNKTIERLFNNWNKLKEYANKMHEYFLYTDVNEIYKQNMKEDNQFPNLFNLSELNASDKVLSSILNKMQELEQRSIEKLDETSINV